VSQKNLFFEGFFFRKFSLARIGFLRFVMLFAHLSLVLLLTVDSLFVLCLKYFGPKPTTD